MSDLVEKIKSDDGLGLVPVCFLPGPVGRLLGRSAFKLDSDALYIGDGPAALRLEWLEVAELQAKSGRLTVACRNGSVHELHCGGRARANAVAVLAQKLRDESLCFDSFLRQAAPVDVQRGLSLFAECLAWRGMPYARAAKALLRTAADNYFSDIHLEPVDHEKVKVTYRLTKEVYNALEISRYHHERLTARLKHLAGCMAHQNDIAQEGAFRHEDYAVRFSCFPTGNGERVSLRIITAVRFPVVSALGWSEDAVQRWLTPLKESRGLFLISGPVGSGKTTALYATLAQLASESGNLRVVTVEDPVEAAIPGICQSSLDQLKEKDLATAFRHLLRQDPDIIALGEIRDIKCIKEALQAGLSGHLVLATFHAGSIEETLDRIRQMGGDDLLVLSGLRGILHLDLKRGDNEEFLPEVAFSLIDGKETRAAA